MSILLRYVPRGEEPIDQDEFFQGCEPDYDDLDPKDAEFIPDGEDISDVETKLEEEDIEGLDGEGEEDIEGLEVGSDGGDDEEEWRVAKDKLRSWNSRIVGIAKEMQNEVALGKQIGQ